MNQFEITDSNDVAVFLAFKSITNTLSMLAPEQQKLVVSAINDDVIGMTQLVDTVLVESKLSSNVPIEHLRLVVSDEHYQSLPMNEKTIAIQHSYQHQQWLFNRFASDININLSTAWQAVKCYPESYIDAVIYAVMLATSEGRI